MLIVVDIYTSSFGSCFPYFITWKVSPGVNLNDEYVKANELRFSFYLFCPLVSLINDVTNLEDSNWSYKQFISALKEILIYRNKTANICIENSFVIAKWYSYKLFLICNHFKMMNR